MGQPILCRKGLLDAALLAIKAVESVAPRRHPEPPGAVLMRHTYHAPDLLGIVGETLSRYIKAAEPAHRGHPEDARFRRGFVEPHHRIGPEAVRLVRVMGEDAGLRVQLVQPGAGNGYPQVAGLIFEQRIVAPIRDTARIIRIVLKAGNMARLLIQPFEPAGTKAQPDIAGVVFEDIGNVVREPGSGAGS